MVMVGVGVAVPAAGAVVAGAVVAVPAPPAAPPAPAMACGGVWPSGTMTAAVTTPFPSVVRAIGLGMLIRPWQLRLVKDWLARIARNVNRFVAIAGSTDGPFWKIAMSLNTRAIPVWLPNRFVQ